MTSIAICLWLGLLRHYSCKTCMSWNSSVDTLSRSGFIFAGELVKAAWLTQQVRQNGTQAYRFAFVLKKKLHIITRNKQTKVSDKYDMLFMAEDKALSRGWARIKSSTAKEKLLRLLMLRHSLVCESADCEGFSERSETQQRGWSWCMKVMHQRGVGWNLELFQVTRCRSLSRLEHTGPDNWLPDKCLT